MEKSIVNHLVNDRKLIMLPAFGGLILCSRFLSTGSLFFAFLIWNIILATVPLLLAFALNNSKKRSTYNYVILVGWLLFLPNAFYIITDFKHLTVSRPDWVFFDSIMLFCFALGGIYLGVKSILIVRDHWTEAFGNKYWKFSLSLLFIACGFGIYLGRILRWNSWDVLRNPQELFIDIFNRIMHPLAYVETWIFTLIYAGYIALSYLFFSRLIQNNHERTKD